jgi:hypothetical protein
MLDFSRFENVWSFWQKVERERCQSQPCMMHAGVVGPSPRMQAIGSDRAFIGDMNLLIDAA